MSTDTSTIETLVIETLTSFEPDGPVTMESSFVELDVDSLDLAEFAQVIEEELGVRLDGKDLKDIRTVGELTTFIAARA